MAARFLRAAVSVVAIGLLAGCVPKPVVRPAYYGPTDDLATLVGKLNARGERLVSFRGEGSFDADLVDPKSKDHTTGGGDVTLLYTPPGNLRLAGKAIVGRVFDIGSNADRYWLILPRQDRMVWGKHESMPGGRSSSLPIRPDLIVEVLGVTPLPTDLLHDPSPALRFNNLEDCYMLTWQTLLSDRFAVQKEVWYDRQTLLPRLVLLFDTAGREVLRATPSDPKTVDGYDPPLEMPSKYALSFPESGSTFSIRLNDLDRERDGAPNARTFAFPQRPGVTKVESLD